MFGGNNRNKPRSARSGNLPQLGLFEIPTDFDPGVNMMADADDDDLEAELAALTGGGGYTGPKARKRTPRPVPQYNISAADIPDDEGDDDVSVDDNDPDLLSELNDIVGEDEPEESTLPESETQAEPPATADSSSDIQSILEKRLEMYEQAEKHAKSIGESSRARRYNRATKTLKDLIKQAKHGKQIDESVIPPEVSTTLKPHETAATEPAATPSRSAPDIPTPSDPEPAPPMETESQPETPDSPVENAETQKLLAMLTERRNQYKIAAVTAKKEGDARTALRYVKTSKQFEMVIQAVENGQPVDLSKMPGPPGSAPAQPRVEQSEVQKSSQEEDPEEDDAPQEGLITASSVMEALEQRLDVYKKHVVTAQEEGNGGKARRMGRVVKQYENAIKLHKAGKPIPVDELPTPPGYAPIPVEGAGAASPPKPAPRAPLATEDSPGPSRASTGSVPSPSSSTSGKFVVTQADRQVAELLARQKEFKLAALRAKKKGEINEAKEYLRQSMGFDKLIEVARSGLPVDFSSLPVSPLAKTHLEEDYDMLSAEDINENDKDDKGILTRMEAQLSRQMKMCLNTRDHNKSIGDVAGANRFERLALNVTKDLDIVRLAKKTPGSAIPKFHYENKEFAVVKSYTELNDNDLELSICRGINYNCTNPKDVDTYVKYEFPYPQDAHYIDYTATVKDTNNPEYNTTLIIPIQRSARTCQRVFKRHSMKFEVYAKGGFFTGLFKGDTLIGTANVKLNPLETQCEIHDSFDLMEGRKKTGGKLEIRIRLRQPIATQQVEQIQEKWLVIDS